MKLSSALAFVAAVTLGAAHAEEGKVGVPESYTAPKTALGHPIHFTTLGSNRGEGTVGVPVSIGHPRHHRHHHSKFDGSSSSSSSSSSSDDSGDDVVQLGPHEEALAKLLALYGKHGNHGRGSSGLPTPAPTTFVTPAPTVPNYSATPSPTKPTFVVTPSPTVPTPAPTSTGDASTVVGGTVQPDASNPYIKQVALPTETPAATLAVESPTPVTELLRDSDAVGTALSANVASGGASASDESSVALPVVVLGCVAAALAVAVAVFVQKKRAQTADDKTASPSASTEVDYKNEMVTPV